LSSPAWFWRDVSKPAISCISLIGGFDTGKESARPTQPPGRFATFSFPLRMLLQRYYGKEYLMNTNYRQLTRSTSNRMIAGVCAGLGDYLNIDPTIVRLLFVLAFFTGFGGIAIVYLVMALVIPEQAPVQPQ
jgi:phage shock protein PspC (stress-responsive transcriptional regulator)